MAHTITTITSARTRAGDQYVTRVACECGWDDYMTGDTRSESRRYGIRVGQIHHRMAAGANAVEAFLPAL